MLDQWSSFTSVDWKSTVTGRVIYTLNIIINALLLCTLIFKFLEFKFYYILSPLLKSTINLQWEYSSVNLILFYLIALHYYFFLSFLFASKIAVTFFLKKKKKLNFCKGLIMLEFIYGGARISVTYVKW